MPSEKLPETGGESMVQDSMSIWAEEVKKNPEVTTILRNARALLKNEALQQADKELLEAIIISATKLLQ